MGNKKNKKNIKLNNKIRKLFDGMPFDGAVSTLSDEILVELSLFIGLEADSLDRETLIRTLRRIWSEGKYHIREQIVSNLSSRSPDSKRPLSLYDENIDKVEMIISVLSGLEHTREEEEAILEQYMDAKIPKITRQKISNTLHYLRLKKSMDKLEEAAGISIDSNGDMEFVHPFNFKLPYTDFVKSLLVRGSVDLSEKMIRGEESDTAASLEEKKDELIIEKQHEIDEFISDVFIRPHPYLDHEKIEELLRRMPPEVEISHIPLPLRTIEDIIKKTDSAYLVSDRGSQYMIERYKTTDIHNMEFPYKVQVSYDRSYLDSLIWRGVSPLPVAEDMRSVDEQILLRLESDLDEIFGEAKTISDGLDVDEEVIWRFIHQFLDPQTIGSQSHKLRQKNLRRILYHLGEYLKPLRERKLREQLLAQTIRDFKQLFPLARSIKRRITFYAGPTNSGKTYTAMERLRSVRTGYYLAPLRLLALEGYESLRSNGVAASLITGEEEIIDEDSTHISSTIEMLNFEVEVECCVIDEIQMIADRDRGWAWANALIGAPAKEVILTGSADSVKAVMELAEYLGEELEVVHFERKNPLHLLRAPTSLKKIEPHTAIVAFSRKEVLSYKQRLSPHHSVSVVYGNLSPEVRREEARKFREGESDILVATDAIAMGLNLPIRTLLFARDNKFDGLRRRELETSEILQIAGRAGRYGLHEEGLIGALDSTTLRTISEKFHSPLPDIELPFSVMANLHHVELIGGILETDKLLDILTFFADNMEFEGPFLAANIESMLEIAAIVDEYDLDLRSRYHLATAPVSIGSPYIESAFHRYIKHLERGEPVPYYAPRDLPSYAHTNEELLRSEDRVKEVSLYLWLGYRFEDKFSDTEAAIEARTRLNRFIEKSLTKADLTKRCTRCGKVLDFSYRYSICESCYRKGKQGVWRRKEKRK